jgi:hypothetical protein
MTRFMILGTTLMAAAAAYGDDRIRPRYDGYGDRGGFANGYRGENPYRQGNPVIATMSDLREIYSRSRVDRHESDHFRRAIDALREFDERARRGRMDGRLLDRALESMSHLATARQLHPRAREVVRMRMRDLERMGSRGHRY